jgi:hypothetical protein
MSPGINAPAASVVLTARSVAAGERAEAAVGVGVAVPAAAAAAAIAPSTASVSDSLVKARAIPPASVAVQSILGLDVGRLCPATALAPVIIPRANIGPAQAIRRSRTRLERPLAPHWVAAAAVSSRVVAPRLVIAGATLGEAARVSPRSLVRRHAVLVHALPLRTSRTLRACAVSGAWGSGRTAYRPTAVGAFAFCIRRCCFRRFDQIEVTFDFDRRNRRSHSPDAINKAAHKQSPNHHCSASH